MVLEKLERNKKRITITSTTHETKQFKSKIKISKYRTVSQYLPRLRELLMCRRKKLKKNLQMITSNVWTTTAWATTAATTVMAHRLSLTQLLSFYSSHGEWREKCSNNNKHTAVEPFLTFDLCSFALPEKCFLEHWPNRVYSIWNVVCPVSVLLVREKKHFHKNPFHILNVNLRENLVIR